MCDTHERGMAAVRSRLGHLAGVKADLSSVLLPQPRESKSRTSHGSEPEVRLVGSEVDTITLRILYKV